jgi:hypothetical protein
MMIIGSRTKARGNKMCKDYCDCDRDCGCDCECEYDCDYRCDSDSDCKCDYDSNGHALCNTANIYSRRWDASKGVRRY